MGFVRDPGKAILWNGEDTMGPSNWEKLEKTKVREGVLRSVVSGAKVMMVMNEIQPGTGPNPHSHSHEQMLYIIKGRAEVGVGDQKWIFGPGDVMVIPPDVPHVLKVLGDEPVLNLDVFSPIREEYL